MASVNFLYRSTKDKSNLVLRLLYRYDGKDYVFGALGQDYADQESFLEKDITPHFQSYTHPIYPQLHGEFEPYMSIIDLLFNVGPDSLSTLMSGNVSNIHTG